MSVDVHRPDLPPGVRIVGRSGADVPEPDDVIEYGDHVTFLGDASAVRTAVKRFHPHD